MLNHFKKIKRKLYFWAALVAAVAYLGMMGVQAIIGGAVSSSAINCAQASTGEDSGLTGGSEEDFTHEGSKAYKAAKSIFKYLTEVRGFSGYAAAGAVGNAYNESGVDPFKIQINSPSYNKLGPRTSHPEDVKGETGTNGWGLFQFSPGSQVGEWAGYTHTEDEGESAEMQLDYIWNKYSGANIGAEGLKNSAQKINLAKADSINDGTFLWFYTVELASGTPEKYDKKKNREWAAKKAYEMFDGDKYHFDANKVGVGTGGTGSSSDSDKDDQPAGCDIFDAMDGEGEISEEGEWANYSDLPDDYKKYAHDPAKLLGERGTGSEWKKLGVSFTSEDQCVGFSVAYGNAIWGLTGNKTGNGIDTADGFASQTGTSTSSTPKAGAIASQKSIDGNSAGHTFVVMHVFKNGDLLVAEQNWRKSGQNNNEKFSWDFRTVKVSQYKKLKTVFAYPGGNSKYHLQW